MTGLCDGVVRDLGGGSDELLLLSAGCCAWPVVHHRAGCSLWIARSNVGGPLCCLGGRSVVWALSPTPDKTLSRSDSGAGNFNRITLGILLGRHLTLSLADFEIQTLRSPYPRAELTLMKRKERLMQAVEFDEAREVVTGPTATEFKGCLSFP